MTPLTLTRAKASAKMNPFAVPTDAKSNPFVLPTAATKVPPPLPPAEASAPDPKPASDRTGEFVRKVHDDACNIFGTVLGPEANDAHKDHFHLDMKKRRRSGVLRIAREMANHVRREALAARQARMVACLQSS